MKDIQDIDLEKTFFHFTKAENLDSILSQGLIPQIGPHAIGIEDTPKVFFSLGAKGILQIIDVWIKWRIRVTQFNIYVAGAYDEKSRRQRIDELNYDFMNGRIFEDEQVKELIFKEMHDFLKDNVYLKLDLVENVDYRLDDIDEVKRNFRNNRDFLDPLYGPNNHQNEYMENWNMHTLSGKVIEPDKIELLSINDKTDALSIVTYLYKTYNKENISLTMLDQFMDFEKQLEQSVKR